MASSVSSTTPRVRLFRNRHRPRSQIDVRVGSSHIVETLLHLRREDYSWYLENEEEINEEFLQLLQESIIPRMFDVELEEYHNQLSPELMPLPEDQLGSKNTRSLNKAIANQSNKRKGKGRKGKKKIPPTDIQQQKDEMRQQRTQEKLAKDISYAFGSTIQMAYRMQALYSKNQSYDHRTLLFPESSLVNDEGVGQKKNSPKTKKRKQAEKETGQQQKFLCPIKLPQRISIWISKFDPNDKHGPDPPGVGFYRPELIPISSLFREPKDELEDSSSDEEAK